MLAGAVHYRDGLPVLPGALPGLGHFPAMITHSAELMREARERLGPMYHLHLGPTVGWYMLCSGPEAFEIIRLRSSYIPLTTNAATEGFLGRHGLLVLRGDQHQRMRAAMNPPFVPRGLSLAGVGQLMADSIERRLAQLPLTAPVRILEQTQTLALELIFRLINVPTAELDMWREQYRRFMQILLPIPWDLPGLPMHRALAAKRWLVAQLTAMITDERQRPPSGSLVSVLAHARDESGTPLGMDELVDNLRLLILAGHETTASVLAWMVIELGRNPELWRELVAEAQRAGGIPKTPQAAKTCPLAEGLFRECLRLHPPAYVTIRTLGEEVKLHGKVLRKDQVVAIALGDIARDPRVFPDPERFSPHRWLPKLSDPAGSRGAAAAPTPPTPIETSQFGGGPHFCLGYHLAVFEATQFAIGLALHLDRRGLRPKLCGSEPRSIYYPLNHPSARTTIEFV